MENGNNENKIIGMIVKSIPSIATVAAIIIGIYAWVEKPINDLRMQNALLEQKINVIQTNELVHIAADIQELKGNMGENATAHSEIDKKLERILTILEKLY